MTVGSCTALQLAAPAHLQGRACSATATVLFMLQSFSIGLGAAAGEVVDYRLLRGAMAAGLACSALCLVSCREERAVSAPLEMAAPGEVG